jgi:hypothetical protein
VVLVPHSTLQLPPGCIPTPAAFFLVERVLICGQSTATFTLAVNMLRRCISIPTAPLQPQQAPQDKQPAASSALHDRQAAAELARLAYCSLATSVVQVMMRQQQYQEDHGEQGQLLGEGCVWELLTLAAELVQAAEMQVWRG